MELSLRSEQNKNEEIDEEEEMMKRAMEMSVRDE